MNEPTPMLNLEHICELIKKDFHIVGQVYPTFKQVGAVVVISGYFDEQIYVMEIRQVKSAIKVDATRSSLTFEDFLKQTGG